MKVGAVVSEEALPFRFLRQRAVDLVRRLGVGKFAFALQPTRPT